MKNWSGDDFGIQAECPWEDDQKTAESVCNHLNVPFRSFNFEKQYREKVVEYFFDEYKKGRTPNPDVMCNKEIKFKLFLERALEEGADLIATGHYARVSPSSLRDTPPLLMGKLEKPEGDTFHLLKGIDPNKDQTYFLYNIRQDQLSHVLFPIGHLPKPEVRTLAEKFNLPNAKRPDSQGICFIGEINVLKFLMSEIPEKIGDIVDIDTKKIVGEHKGIYFYTIGQREGLGIGGQEIPYFVVDKDADKNILYVGHGNNHPAMFKKEVELENIHWIAGKQPQDLTGLSAMIRYRQKPQAGKLTIEPSTKTHNIKPTTYNFFFDEPQRAVTSGQSLVIYKDDECLGGGIIA
jgi:tRNA-specific 2-thiouridylase